MKQKLYFNIGIMTIIFGLILSIFYRPFVYNHKIIDFGFADTIGSFVSVIGFCCIIWAFKDFSNKEKNLQIIFATFIYSVVWESFGYFGIYGTFDWKDIIAGIISGVLTFIVKTIIDNNFNTA